MAMAPAAPPARSSLAMTGAAWSEVWRPEAEKSGWWGLAGSEPRPDVEGLAPSSEGMAGHTLEGRCWAPAPREIKVFVVKGRAALAVTHTCKFAPFLYISSLAWGCSPPTLPPVLT